MLKFCAERLENILNMNQLTYYSKMLNLLHLKLPSETEKNAKGEYLKHFSQESERILIAFTENHKGF